MVVISLFSGILLAAAVFAFPSSNEPRYARRVSRSLQLSNEAATNSTFRMRDSNDWAGAAWDSDSGGTFTSVTGTFKVPRPKGPDGSVSVWVGIDGDTCFDVILQAGIDVSFSHGHPSYKAWSEWFPENSISFHGFPIHSGDEIRLTVTATSPDSGKAKIENLTKKKHVEKVFHSQITPLCQQNAEWIVEDYQNNEGEDVPVCNFGKVEFTDAYATRTHGHRRVTPDGADILVMQKGDEVITSVHENRNGVTIKYL